MRNPAPLVIVAETVEGTALQMLVHNHVNRTFQAVAIKAAPMFARMVKKARNRHEPSAGPMTRTISQYCSASPAQPVVAAVRNGTADASSVCPRRLRAAAPGAR